MKERVKISIITICYNNERDIRPTLESVVNQTYQDIEYIVVDGASTDGSMRIVNEYKDKISRIISEPDNGMYEALNKGFRAATGDVVGMIHAGDRLYDNSVVEKIAGFYTHNDVDVTYGHSKIVDGNDVPRRINRSPDYSRKLVQQGWMPSHQSIYCRRELFEKYGYYRTDLGSGGDYEWFVRYFYRYSDLVKIQLIDDYIVRFSLGGQSTKNVWRKLSKKHFDYVKCCWKLNGVTPPHLIVWKMFLRKVPQYILAYIQNERKEKDK